MLRKIILPVAILALLALAPLTAKASDAGSGTDPAQPGCYVYAPASVNEGDTFTSTVACNSIASADAYGFQFGTTFTPSSVTVNGITSQPVAVQVGTGYTAGDFVASNPLVGMNSLSNLYAVSHTSTGTNTTGDFILGTFVSTVATGIVADSSATVDLRNLKLSDHSGADIAALLPHSQASITINNLVIALRGAGTIRVQSDGSMTKISSVSLDLDEGAATSYTSTSTSASFKDFSVLAFQYPQDKTSADIAISMTSHLSCTKNILLSDGPNASSVLGTTYTLKAGDVTATDGAGKISLADATLVGGYIGTSRSDASDINGDGAVNIYDLVAIGRNYTATSGTCS